MPVAARQGLGRTPEYDWSRKSTRLQRVECAEDFHKNILASAVLAAQSALPAATPF